MNAEMTNWIESHRNPGRSDFEQAGERGYLDNKDFALEILKQDEFLVFVDSHGNDIGKRRNPYLGYLSPRLRADKEVVVTAIMYNYDALTCADEALWKDEEICKLASLYKKGHEVVGNNFSARHKRNRYFAKADKLGQKMLEQLAKSKTTDSEAE